MSVVPVVLNHKMHLVVHGALEPVIGFILLFLINSCPFMLFLQNVCSSYVHILLRYFSRKTALI